MDFIFDTDEDTREELLTVCGFQRDQPLTAHGREGAIVITRSRMTAGELLETIESLKDAAEDLLVRLAKICGWCSVGESGCTCDGDDAPEDLREFLRQSGVCVDELDRLMEDGGVVYED